MANPEHLAKLNEGVQEWNRWRKGEPFAAQAVVDLSDADLRSANLREADLSNANLGEANLSGATLRSANLSGANLSGANLHRANLNEASLRYAFLRGADLINADLSGADLNWAVLSGAHLMRANLSKADLSWADFSASDVYQLSGADLREADLSGATLGSANLSGANLSGANLCEAVLVKANLEGANLTACSVYGISAWNVRLEGAIQSNLVITRENEPPIQVDNLEVAQFIYLLLNNKKIRHVIDTITSKVVLILGRFTPERKAVLDTIREELRKRDYLPVLFDFDPSSSQTTMETISTLAHMSRFIIADLTDAKSILGELERITTALQLVPVQLILQKSADIPPMGDSFLVRQSVLKPYYYVTHEELIASIAQVIAPAADKAEEFRERLAEIRKQYLPWQQPL